MRIHPRLKLLKFVSAATLLSAMDQSAAPCVNFFQYACGTWNRQHAIPEDRSSINTFEVLGTQLLVILGNILEEPPNDEDNNATLKAKMFYKSCMDIRGYNENSFRSHYSERSQKLFDPKQTRLDMGKSFLTVRFHSSHQNDRRCSAEEDPGVPRRLASGSRKVLETTRILRGGSARSTPRGIQRGSIVGTMGRPR